VIHEEGDKTNNNRRQLLINAVTVAVLLITCAGALFLRVYFPQASVIRDGVTYFKENDPWYHVRLVENLLRHFPYRIYFDPYSYFPYGQPVLFAPLFDLLLGLVIMIVSFGHPTQELIQQVSLYYPAVLGVLVIPPVYFIGKELFDRRAGLLAAFIVGFMPNTFLARSLMGFTDHHVAEVLLSTITILFLILSLKRGSEAGASFTDIRNRDWKKVRKPLIYALLTGASLAMYLLAWLGGLLLVFMLFSAFVVIYLIDYLRGKSVDYLVATGTLTFFIALVLILPFLGELPFANLCVISLVGGTLVLPALYLVSWLADKKGLSRFYYPFLLAGLGAAGAAGLFLVDKPLFLDIVDKFRVFTPDTGVLTISEARPLLYSRGPFSWTPAYDEFTTGLFLAPVAFIIVIWNAIKKTSSQAWLFIVWCTVMLAATLGQIRFSYYLTVNVALLSAYLLWKVSALIYAFFDRILLKNFRREQQRLALSEQRVRRNVRGNKPVSAIPEIVSPAPTPKKPVWPSLVSYAVIAAVIGSLTVYYNFQPAIAVASSFSGPSKDWYDALVWLRNNSPEPFPEGPDFYYNLYDKPANGTYPYPASAYGIMSWWDYGHWITEIAHRIPNANPHQAGAVDAATFLIAQDEEAGKKMLDKLGSRYIVIDLEMAVPYRVSGDNILRGKFYAFAVWTGDVPENYFEIFYKQNNGKFEQVPIYYPAYYQSMCTRLYNFKGEAKPGQNTVVISWAERSGFKEIVSEQTFATYDEAKTYLSKQSGGNWRIVGKDPFVSPVPLKALEHFQPVYHSDNWAAKFGEGEPIAYVVEIYSYTP
jgi:dolichyl-diphosphooligosaccharide--protein glycosyltransferase